MNKYLFFGMIAVFISCHAGDKRETGRSVAQKDADQKAIAAMLDSFNLAAADADFNGYFDFFTKDATFNGTDAAESWDKNGLMEWSKPYFDKKITWTFTSIQRNIYFGKCDDIAWFDELLKTQMKICRGSGVVIKEEGRWKVQQYVLSMTIPNKNILEVIKIKTPIEDSLMQLIQKR